MIRCSHLEATRGSASDAFTPAAVAQAALDVVLASVSPPPRLAAALPSLGAAGAAVAPLAAHARARSRRLSEPPTEAAQADEPTSTPDSEAGSAPSPGLPHGAQPQPGLSRELGAALAGAREPSLDLVAAYAAEIAASFESACVRSGGQGRAGSAHSSASGGRRSSRSSGRNSARAAAESDGSQNDETDDEEAAGAPSRGGRSAPRGVGASPAPRAVAGAGFTNWADALASLPPLPPPPS